jgi:CheY-like chemotaxis protein
MKMSTKILIIEDNLPNHELVEYLLKSAGYATLSAWDGVEGLHMAQETQPDLILCDLQMPRMGGYELVQLLKADVQLRKIPIIAVTASSMSGDSTKAMEAGFDGYISKPIEPETFIKQMEDFLPPGLVRKPAKF